MFCRNSKLFGFFFFAIAIFIVVWGGYAFAEHFYALERNSFFSFNTNFLNGFWPWNPRPDIFPGEKHTPGLALLTASFAFQFFKTGITTQIAVILTGFIFSIVFSLSLKRIWKSRFALCTAPVWAAAYLFFTISPKFPEHFVYALLWASIFFLCISRLKKPLPSLVVAGLTGCCAAWLIGFVATMAFWIFYSIFFFLHHRPRLAGSLFHGLFTVGIALQPLSIGNVHAITACQIYRSDFEKKWYQTGFSTQWSLYNRVKKTERLVMETRYQEALETANPYWFSHPCPVEDLVTGKNTLYPQLPVQQITLRQWLAAYTKLALIGSHRLNEDFFSYYRIPEIYNEFSDEGIPYFSNIKILFNRLMGNSTGVYSQAMNLMELSGPDYFLLDESIQATLICEQYGLAEKYIRLLASTLFYQKQAEIYRKASEILQQSVTNGHAEPEVLQIVTKIKERRKLGLTTWMNETDDVYRDAVALWRQNPASLENLEYLSLFDLLYKRLDSVVSHIGTYIDLSKQTPPYHLPESWQEMLFIMMQDMPNRIPVSVYPLIEQMEWDEKVLKQCRLFYQIREQYAKGGMTPIEITKRFGHTFVYNYYFRRFLDIWPHPQKKPPLAH